MSGFLFIPKLFAKNSAIIKKEVIDGVNVIWIDTENPDYVNCMPENVGISPHYNKFIVYKQKQYKGYLGVAIVFCDSQKPARKRIERLVGFKDIDDSNTLTDIIILKSKDGYGVATNYEKSIYSKFLPSKITVEKPWSTSNAVIKPVSSGIHPHFATRYCRKK